MTLSSNPSYQALAATAATALGNPTQSIVKAILAQWQCELGNVSYPPTRNNPGNVARGWADAVGIPYTVQMPNPQPGNPIVTFASAADGARAYAGGIRMFARYAPARLAIARGDGRAFLIAITGAGYGTNVACALRVFGGPGTVSTTPAPTGTLTGASGTPNYPAEIDALLRSLGISTDPNHVISAPEQDRIWFADDHLFGSFTLEGKTVSQLPAIAESRQSSPGAQVQDAVGNALAAIPGVLGGIVVNSAVLILILVLAFSGFRDLLSGGQS